MVKKYNKTLKNPESYLAYFMKWCYVIMPLPFAAYAAHVYSLPGDDIKSSAQDNFPIFLIVHIFVFVVLVLCTRSNPKSIIRSLAILFLLIATSISFTLAAYMCYVAYGPY